MEPEYGRVDLFAKVMGQVHCLITYKISRVSANLHVILFFFFYDV